VFCAAGVVSFCFGGLSGFCLSGLGLSGLGLSGFGWLGGTAGVAGVAGFEAGGRARWARTAGVARGFECFGLFFGPPAVVPPPLELVGGGAAEAVGPCPPRGGPDAVMPAPPPVGVVG
jgi:hypothetical protein